MLSNPFSKMAFVFILVKTKATLNDQIRPNLDRCMPLSLRRSWASALRLCPCHYFQVQNIEIIKEIFSIPPSKNEHFGSTKKSRWMRESCWWGAWSFRALIPSHSDRVKCMQISENRFFSFSAKNLVKIK